MGRIKRKSEPSDWEEAFAIAARADEDLRSEIFGGEYPAGVVASVPDDAMAPFDLGNHTLRPYAPTVKRWRPPAGRAVQNFSIPVGDATRPVQPGEVARFEVFAEKMFQPRKLVLTQFFVGDMAGGGPCRWPVEACYVGDRVIDGAMALYDGFDGAPVCKVGHAIRLRLRNPLAVPAAVCGALVGRTVPAAALRPLTAAELEQLRGDAPAPKPLSAADLERLVLAAAGVADEPLRCCDCGQPCAGLGDDPTQPRCGPCLEKHRGTYDKPLVTRAAAGLPDPATAPAKRDVLAPHPVIYCEHAPPREVVEAATCLLDGDEVGAPARRSHLRVPLCYTARMKVAWERHEKHRLACGGRLLWDLIKDDAAGLRHIDDVRLIRIDNDFEAPRGIDDYGGRVATSPTASLTSRRRALPGFRCALCGGWLREVVL